jgi:hypothetical protein
MTTPTTPRQASTTLRRLVGQVGHSPSTTRAPDGHLRTQIHVVSRECAERIQTAARASELVDHVTDYAPHGGYVVVHWRQDQA